MSRYLFKILISFYVFFSVLYSSFHLIAHMELNVTQTQRRATHRRSEQLAVFVHGWHRTESANAANIHKSRASQPKKTRECIRQRAARSNSESGRIRDTYMLRQSHTHTHTRDTYDASRSLCTQLEREKERMEEDTHIHTNRLSACSAFVYDMSQRGDGATKHWNMWTFRTISSRFGSVFWLEFVEKDFLTKFWESFWHTMNQNKPRDNDFSFGRLFACVGNVAMS